MIKPTNAQLFAVAGNTMFGPRWTQPMAELLEWPLDDKGQNRTVQRIKSAANKGEEYRIADGVFLDIAKHAREQAAALLSMAEALETMLDD